MHDIALNELWTLVVALLTIGLGAGVIARVPVLARYSIPPAVVGGFLVAVLLLVLQALGWKFSFGSQTRSALLLVFFTTLGLSARLSALRGGGVAVALMSLAIALLAIAQNAVGASVAWAFGEPASLAVFLGSAAFLGGHGTTAAWAGQPLAASAGNAFDVGMACATLGLVAGGVLGSVVATRLLDRAADAPGARTAKAPVHGEVTLHSDKDDAKFGLWTSSDRWLRQLLVLSLTIGIALAWQAALAGRGINIPPFLACLLTAVAFTNLADLLKRGVDLETADLVGTVALRLFLAMSLMSLDLTAVFRAAGLILSAVVLQCAVTALIAVTLVRYAATRGSLASQSARDGAVAAGGFMGFGLGAMPVGLSVMQRITLQHGAAPRAFLVVTLAASLVQDLINAGAVQATLELGGTLGGSMPATLEGQLVVAISSRALFDFEEENRLFEGGDDQAYMQLQLQRLDLPAPPGVAFSLVRKLLAFNAGAPRVEVVMLSRNDPVSGLRVFRSAQHYGLAVQRGVFTRGQPPWRYLAPLRANLFLSANDADVRAALNAGVPAARVFPHAARASAAHPQEVRIAFDGDAVLFSDEAERVFQSQGLDAFHAHETAHAARPLAAGPFKPLLLALQRLQREPAASMRIRTALVTARSAPAHERAMRTLMDWHIEVDEAMFLGGLPKGEFLREFEPDFYFDDQTGHVASAAAHVPAGHVASGISNS